MEFICFKLQRRNLHIRLLLMKTMLIGFKLQRRNLHKVEKDTFFMVGEFQTPTEKFTHITACKAAIEALFQTPTEKFTRNAPRISAVVTAFQTPTEKFTPSRSPHPSYRLAVSNSNGEIYTGSAAAPSEFVGGFKLQRRNLHWFWQGSRYKRKGVSNSNGEIYTKSRRQISINSIPSFKLQRRNLHSVRNSIFPGYKH